MDKIKPLFTATATANGGRNGHTELSDHSVAADLSVPKEMGDRASPTPQRRSTFSRRDMQRALAVRSTSSPSSTRRMRAKPR